MSIGSPAYTKVGYRTRSTQRVEEPEKALTVKLRIANAVGWVRRSHLLKCAVREV